MNIKKDNLIFHVIPILFRNNNDYIDTLNCTNKVNTEAEKTLPNVNEMHWKFMKACSSHNASFNTEILCSNVTLKDRANGIKVCHMA